MKTLIKRKNKNNETRSHRPHPLFVTPNTNIKVYLKFMSFAMWKSRGASSSRMARLRVGVMCVKEENGLPEKAFKR